MPFAGASRPGRAEGIAAVALGGLPIAALFLLPRGHASTALPAGVVVAVAAAAFAMLAGSLRRVYRHASQATRLVMAFAAVLTPLLVCYPLGAATSDRLTRQVIETDYAPSIARHPQDLRAALARAQQEIDRFISPPDSPCLRPALQGYAGRV